jgi:hypothetical protein
LLELGMNFALCGLPVGQHDLAEEPATPTGRLSTTWGIPTVESVDSCK